MISALLANFDAQVHGVRVLVIDRRTCLASFSESDTFTRFFSLKANQEISDWMWLCGVGVTLSTQRP